MNPALVRILVPLTLVLAAVTVTPQLLALRIAQGSPTLEGLARALELDPENPELHVGLGAALRDRPGHRNDALARLHLERAVELNPLSWSHRRELARLHESVGRRGEAEARWLEARALDPIGPQTAWSLGNFYLRGGEVERALPLFEQSMRAKPRYQRSAVPILLVAGVPAEALVDMSPENRSSRLRLLRFLALPGADARAASLAATVQIWDELQGLADPPTVEEASFYVRYLLAVGEAELAERVRQELIVRNGGS